MSALGFAEDSRRQPPDALAVADGVDLHDLAVRDGEGHDNERASASGDDDAAAPFTRAGSTSAAGCAPSWAGKIPFRNRNLGAADPAPGPARQLPGRLGSPAHHGSYLIEGQIEHVVKHEGQALGRGQSIEHHLEG